MRQDLIKTMKLKKDWSLAKAGRENKCDYRTIKKYIGLRDSGYTKRSKYDDKLQEFIRQRLEINPKVKASVIFSLITDFFEDKTISERQIRRRVNHQKEKMALKVAKTPIRINHKEGFQIQIDWKESLKAKSSKGDIIKFNILGLRLPYSKKTLFEVTETRKSEDLFAALARGFTRLGGVTETILFDNMKTIVDHAKSTSSNKIYNNKALQFCNDFQIKLNTTETYNPQGKGSIETQMKFLEVCKELDGHIESIEDVEKLVRNIERRINNKHLLPEELMPLPRNEIIAKYKNAYRKIIVAKDSMIHHKKRRYSVPTSYIGKELYINETEQQVEIYDFMGNLIRKYTKSTRYYNYSQKDFHDIITQPKYIKYMRKGDSIEDFVAKQFKKLGGI